MLPESAIPKRGTNTGPFWDGAKEGKLMLPHCKDCNRVHWYPRFICPFCHSMNLEWIEGSGEGTVHTFAVQHLTPPAWQAAEPQADIHVVSLLAGSVSSRQLTYTDDSDETQLLLFGR